LTSIWEASGMLLGGTFKNDRSSRHKLLSIVRDECKRLIESVNRILDLSRMEGGMMDYHLEKKELRELIQETVFKLSPIARSSDISMRFALNTNDIFVLADSEKLNQLLENLIGNALKFTGAGGSVTVGIIIPESSGRTIHVYIKDTGCGIEQKYLETIFEKFYKIENQKNTSRGSGLGLSIAKHIVNAHGGSIWVESIKDMGSTFYFSLPQV
jgi:two-component system sensor histidine kinase GlrK